MMVILLTSVPFVTLVTLANLATLITLVTLVILVTLVTLATLITLVSLFQSANKFYRAHFITVLGFFNFTIETVLIVSVCHALALIEVIVSAS